MRGEPPITPSVSRPIHVVYGFFLHPGSNWRAIMAGQIGSLRRYGLLAEADLSIVITDPHATPGLADFVAGLCGPRATILIHLENRYEYWALHRLWQIACACPEARVAYFHSKSVSRNIPARCCTEKALTRGTFEEWRQFLALLDDERIDMLGLFPAADGWVWYNFWWAKASYVAGLPEPVTSEDRHSHEGWLGGCRAAPRSANAFSIYAWEIRSYGQREADRRMRWLARWTLLQRRSLRTLLRRLGIRL
ncbi:hypothetical protein [Ancylobacter radicis]|uniref:Uncharacterized protein n=1 Tax=Ancylobacter radicis TaxID=2836179 RepID=A0ABS5RBW2_9HYPH|nr:hypothetical protein [Ancylobacter radicis]MBS9479145.1 hypothetical protein [Ancylobacter radicis]